MTAPVPLPRRIEVLAGLSVAIDLGLGQPAEHMLRSAVVASRLAERLGLRREQREHGVLRNAGDVDRLPCRLPGVRPLVRRRHRGPPRRLPGRLVRHALPALPARQRRQRRAAGPAHARVGHALPRRARPAGIDDPLPLLVGSGTRETSGLGPDVERAIAFTFERYDGAGLPGGAAGERDPDRDAHSPGGGHGRGAPPHVRRGRCCRHGHSRRRGQFDPVVVDAFTAKPKSLFPADGDDPWDCALDLAPDPKSDSTQPASTRLLVARSATSSTSSAPSPSATRERRKLAEAAAGGAGSADRRGRTPYVEPAICTTSGGSVSPTRSGRARRADRSEWERVRMHPYLTERVLKRIPGLAACARSPAPP